MPLEIAFSPLLVLASFAIAISASFTALRMTSNLRHLPISQKKKRVAQGAFALGCGIWSMHFVGMLAVNMPITIAYAPLPTLGSALIAILVTGAALLSLHFGVRNKFRIVVAGIITGIGIVIMHYLGMSAISANCFVSYNPVGLVIAIFIDIAASIAAMELAYGQRKLTAAIAGATVLGIAISSMHYSAIYFTQFSVNGDVALVSNPYMSNEALALVVALSAFVICGLFLLSAVPNDAEASNLASAPANKEGLFLMEISDHENTASNSTSSVPLSRANLHSGSDASAGRIPYDRNNTIRFLTSSSLFMAQADGHYTKLHNGEEELFCPWPISRLEKNLNAAMFVRTHRSYIVNREKISGFRRDGDKAYCVLGENANLEAPVSRGRRAEFRKILRLG